MKRKGISLIVLVITIIVIIILATAVIVTVAKNNPIERAKEAVIKNDAKDFATELNLALANEKLNDYLFKKEDIDAYEVGDIQKYIPSFTDKYYGKLCIEQGRLCFVGGNVTEKEKAMLEAAGILEGSYITKDKIDDILSKVSNIPADATTTDITEYIDGVSPEQVDKFTIFQGNLYYRWEKTSYQERYLLHSNNVPFLPGDANVDGTLNQSDSDIIRDFAFYQDPQYIDDNINLVYSCDINSDTFIDTLDVANIQAVISGIKKLEEIINFESQSPSFVKFAGDFNLYNLITIPNGVNAEGYEELVKIIPNMKKKDAGRFIISDGAIYYRSESLTEEELNWATQYEFPVL